MAFKSVEQYQKNPVGYPADDINPELKKNKEWYLALCEAMWSDFVTNQCAFPFSFAEGERSVDELRAYATGRQNMDKIKGYLLKRQHPNDPNSRFVTKMNISWQGIDYLPKMLDIMCSFNSKIDYDVNATAIDDDSMDLKMTDIEAIKYSLNQDVQAFMKKTQFNPNIKVNPQELGAQTEADVDLLIDSGGFNLQHEIAAQVVCTKTKKESYFPVIQDLCFLDSIILGRLGMRIYIDKTINAAKIDWLDPKYCIVPRSQYLDFRDKTRWGYIRFMTVAQIKEEGDLTDAEITMLAKDYAWMNPEYQTILANGNGYLNPATRDNYFSQYGVDPINDVRIMVLEMQSLTNNIDNTLYTTRESNGVSLMKTVGWDYEVKGKEKDNGAYTERSQVVRKVEARWIVGTKYFLNYGPAEHVTYKGEKGNRAPTLDGFFAQTKNKSIIERCISLVDDMNAAVFKRRNAIATLPPAPRMIIEQGLLENVELAGKMQEPEDLIKSFEERGILVVNRVDEFNKPIQVSGKTIEFVPSGIIEDITMFTNEIIQAKDAIKDVTGVNDIMAAGTPEARTGLGVSKLATVASQNALYPTFNAFKYVFEPAFEGVIDKWQMICQKGERNIVHVPIGASTAQIFKIGSDFANAKFSLRVDMTIGDDEKAMLLQEITKLKDARRVNGGTGGITGAQYLKIYDLIMAGNRKLAQFVLAKIETLQQQRDLSITQANQQSTIQSQMQSTMLAEKGKQKTYQIEGAVKATLALITAAGNRKNVLIEALCNAIPGEGIPSEDIRTEIAKCEQEIAMLLQSMHQDAADTGVQPGPNQPPQGPPQQQAA